jgi:hypothetical protein
MALTPIGQNTKSLIDLAKENTFSDSLPTERTWIRAATISSENWNALRPFQFIICEAQGNDVYRRKAGKGNVFTLPIPPEALDISTQFAINTTATMSGGIIEEHAGIVFKMVNISGTMGVLFGKEEAVIAKQSPFVESIFAGVVTNARNTATVARIIFRELCAIKEDS